MKKKRKKRSGIKGHRKKKRKGVKEKINDKERKH